MQSYTETFPENPFAVPTSTYDFVYVSIGGKINEREVQFNKPNVLSEYRFPSNATFQMVPSFIRYPNTKNTTALVVVIDDFSDPELQNTNQTFIQNIQKKFPHITAVLHNINLTAETIDAFAKSLVQWIISLNISPQKCMIANYIRFRGGISVLNSQIEFKLPRVIQQCLDAYKVLAQDDTNATDKDGSGKPIPLFGSVVKPKQVAPYSSVLYQWFGYQYFTYNIVFSYKEYNTHMLQHLTVINLLTEFCDMTQLVSGNVSNMFMYEKAREPRALELLLKFLSHSVDITSYSTRSGVICSRLCDFAPSYITP
jgi:hypothetical protein